MPRISLIILFIAHVSSEETPCREGWYGVDCGLQCSDACRPLETFPCNKETGKCSEGCKRGFYGPQCEKNCPCTGPCIQDTGDCIGQQSTSIPTSPTTPLQQQDEDKAKMWMILAVVFIVLFPLMVCLLVFCIFLIRRGARHEKHAEEIALMSKKQDCENVYQQLNRANDKIKILEENAEAEKNPTCKNKSEAEKKIKNMTRQLDEADKKIKEFEDKNMTQQLDEADKKIKELENKNETHLKDIKQLEEKDANHVKKIEQLEEKLEAKKKSKKTKATDQLKDAEKRIEQLQQLEKKHEQLLEERNTMLKKLGLHQNSTYYLLKEKDLKKSSFLQCIWLELDPQKVNVAAASLDEYGKLSNKPHPSDSQREGGLKNYSGTTTTAPLQLTGSTQYWEVENNIAFNKTIPENETLLDLGFCSAEDQDKERFTPERKPFCSLRVINCSTHKQICLTVLSDKKHACYQTDKEVDVDDGNVPTISLKLGVLMHENGKKISFFDVNNHKNIQTASLELKEEIWPMFGLGAEGRTGMNLTLICGNAIDMTNEKMALIKEASC